MLVLKSNEISYFLFCWNGLATDTYIQKARKNYQDSRARRNLNRLNDELHDVQRIMVQNIDDVLQRGEQISGNSVPCNLLHSSQLKLLRKCSYSTP